MSSILFQLLIKDHYILYYEGQLVVTNKFIRDFKTPIPKSTETLPEPEKAVVVTNTVTQVEQLSEIRALAVQSLMPVAPINVVHSPLKELILKAKVPAKISTSNGFYSANQFSKPAEKELLKMIASGIKLDILTAATALYYKAGGARQKIGNFIMEGTWQTYYDEMAASLEAGNTNEYIKKGLSSNEQDGFTKYER